MAKVSASQDLIKLFYSDNTANDTKETTVGLSNAVVYAMIPASDLARARRFYEDTLGFKSPDAEAPLDMIRYECGGTWFVVYLTAFAGTAQHTVATWAVDDFDATFAELRAKGVIFENYDMPDIGLKTVDGVAEMEGFKTAWFKDTEGNTLSIGSES
jgi:catechol 2,3-dioxygenase-like lactoylglutathione lyase family enzyme